MSDPVEIEGVLDRFRQWLVGVRAEAATMADAAGLPASEASPPREFGLINLVEEFTALRQELKLQTKSSRALQEQSEALLSGLRQAIEQFRSVTSGEEQAVWDAGRPLAEGLASLDEALERGRLELEKAQRRFVDESPQAMETVLDELLKRQSWFRRRLFRGYHGQVLETLRSKNWAVRKSWFESLLEGYGLVQSRLRRVMQAEAVERIACLGREVDPERMIVIEVVDDPSQHPHTVVEELRRGYTWRGRVVRYAEVRATSAYSSAIDTETVDSQHAGTRDTRDISDQDEHRDGSQEPGWLETH
jgi:molecular chaperone GrpE